MTRMKVKPHEPASGGRKRLPGLPRICRDVLTYAAAFLFLASVRCFGADEPPLPQLLQKLHDLYLDDYGLFAEAFSGEVKLAPKTGYGQELQTNINLCRPYQHMIVDDSAKLIPKVDPLSSDAAEKKETLIELIYLHKQLAQVNEYLADVLLKLSFETGLDWRHQFNKLQGESVY